LVDVVEYGEVFSLVQVTVFGHVGACTFPAVPCGILVEVMFCTTKWTGGFGLGMCFRMDCLGFG